MKTLIVAGTWDLNGGKKSGLMEKLYLEWKKYTKEEDIVYINGGNYNELDNIMETLKNYDVIFWMAYIPNDLKTKTIKSYNPYALVIGSKRNDNNESFVTILNKALLKRENLTIEFSKNINKFEMLVFDPLGTLWFQGSDIDKCVYSIYKRVEFLLTTKRDHVHKANKENILLKNDEFFEYVRLCADIFQKTIEHAPGVTRFLGNASYRDKKYIYMSERDVDKTLIDKTHFITTYLKDGKAFYLGDKKPSKDTIVQLNLYEKLKRINYIVHSHCYIKDAPFTNIPVPCGALDEIDEVLEVIKDKYNDNFNLDYYGINLKGHGCLIMGNNLSVMKKTSFVTRRLPEVIN